MTRAIRSTALSAALLAAIAAVPLMAASGSAEAYSGKRYENTSDRQSERIEAGRRSGKITYFEGLKLRREQARIAATKRKFKADGYLDHSERHTLRQMQWQASRHIRKEATDGYSRWHVLPRVGR